MADGSRARSHVVKHGVGEVALPFEEMSLTPEQSHFLGNLRLQLIDLSRRLEQDVNEDVADYVLFRLQQALNLGWQPV